MVGMGVSDDGTIHGPPGIDEKVAGRTIETMVGHLQEWRHEFPIDQVRPGDTCRNFSPV
jgi:hypothetical protein